MAQTINMNSSAQSARNESTNGSSCSQSFVTPWGTDPERYWERPDYARAIARTILDQICSSAIEHFGREIGGSGMPLWFGVIASWGVYNNATGEMRTRVLRWRDMPAVAIHVDGFEHTGWVIISLDEGSDTYELELADEQMFARNDSRVTDVYCTELAERIDTAVESGTGTEAEYHAKIEQAHPLEAWAAKKGVKVVYI